MQQPGKVLPSQVEEQVDHADQSPQAPTKIKKTRLVLWCNIYSCAFQPYYRVFMSVCAFVCVFLCLV